jgi:hypothetical protein
MRGENLGSSELVHTVIGFASRTIAFLQQMEAAMTELSRPTADNPTRTGGRLSWGLLLVAAILAIVLGLLAIERVDDALGRISQSADRPIGLIDTD